MVYSLIPSSSYRNKVDLTKYIEEHNFNFDNVFDDRADNNEVITHFFELNQI